MLRTCLCGRLLAMHGAFLIHGVCIDDGSRLSIRHRDAGGIVRMDISHENNFGPSSFLIQRRAAKCGDAARRPGSQERQEGSRASDPDNCVSEIDLEWNPQVLVVAQS
jgi:hypothetical protein